MLAAHSSSALQPAPAALPADGDAPAAFLTELVCGQPARRVAVQAGAAPVVVGRLPECALQVDSQYVSRRHFTVAAAPKGSGVLLRNLSATNPVLLGPKNEPAGASETPLADGDTITVQLVRPRGRTESLETRRGET